MSALAESSVLHQDKEFLVSWEGGGLLTMNAVMSIALNLGSDSGCLGMSCDLQATLIRPRTASAGSCLKKLGRCKVTGYGRKTTEDGCEQTATSQDTCVQHQEAEGRGVGVAHADARMTTLKAQRDLTRFDRTAQT